MAVPGFRLAGVARRLLHRGQIDGRGVGRGPDRTPHVPLPLQDAQGFAARYAHGLAGNSGDLDHAPKRTARETALEPMWSMIFSENRYPPRIKSGAGFFGVML